MTPIPLHQLLVTLETWTSADDPDVYDLGAMMSLLGACLSNLGTYGVPGELEEVANYLEPDQLHVLQRLAAYATEHPADDDPSPTRG